MPKAKSPYPWPSLGHPAAWGLWRQRPIGGLRKDSLRHGHQGKAHHCARAQHLSTDSFMNKTHEEAFTDSFMETRQVFMAISSAKFLEESQAEQMRGQCRLTLGSQRSLVPHTKFSVWRFGLTSCAKALASFHLNQQFQSLLLPFLKAKGISKGLK